MAAMTKTAGSTGITNVKVSKTNIFFAAVLGMVTVLVAMGNRWTDFGFPEIMTANRVAYLLMFVSVMALGVLRPGSVVRVHPVVALQILALLMVGTWGAVSAMFTTNPQFIKLGSIAEWFVFAAATYAAYVLAKSTFPHGTGYYVNVVILCSFLIMVATLIWALEFVSAADLININWRAIRSGINKGISVGLNRFLNGLFVLFIVPMSVSLGVIRRRGLLNLMSWFVFIGFSLLTLVSGSRQNLVAIALFVTLLYAIVNIDDSNRRSRRTRLTRALGTIFVVVLLTWQVPALSDWFVQRFVETTEMQLSQESGRRHIYMTALKTIASTPLFGLGPGTFTDVHGVAPHNGYLGLASQFGLPALVIVFGAMAVILIWSYRRRPRWWARGNNRQLFSPIFVGVLVYVFWLANWNDLLSHSMHWILMTLLIATTEE